MSLGVTMMPHIPLIQIWTSKPVPLLVVIVPLLPETDLDLGYQLGAINYQVDQKNQQYPGPRRVRVEFPWNR